MIDTSHAPGFLKFRATLEVQTTDNAYVKWIGANFERLTAALLESGCTDTSKWIRQQYTLETGKTP